MGARVIACAASDEKLAACKQLGAGEVINYETEDLRERVKQDGTDEEILEWCFEKGRRLNQGDLVVWSAFVSKLGWRDFATPNLEEAKRKHGLTNRDERIQRSAKRDEEEASIGEHEQPSEKEEGPFHRIRWSAPWTALAGAAPRCARRAFAPSVGPGWQPPGCA